MGITAVGRLGRTKRSSFNLVFLGALLFIMSDSVIGLNRFTGPVEHAGPIVMSTYLLAQYLLVKGYTAFIEIKTTGLVQFVFLGTKPPHSSYLTRARST